MECGIRTYQDTSDGREGRINPVGDRGADGGQRDCKLAKPGEQGSGEGGGRRSWRGGSTTECFVKITTSPLEDYTHNTLALIWACSIWKMQRISNKSKESVS